MTTRLAGAALAGACLVWASAGCRQSPAAVTRTPSDPQAMSATTAPDQHDEHSHANPWEVRVTHVALDLAADFQAHVLAGTATLSLEAMPAATAVVVDTKDLTIERVTSADGTPLRHTVGPEDRILGRALRIDLPTDRRTVVITYRTSPQAAALQWLAPSQTAGGKQPYLFSQGESILTRSWIPTQDSPGVRQTYNARIVAPAPLTVVMSAESLTPQGVSVPGGTAREFTFRLEQSVAPYLIAIAIGELAFKPVGPRSGIYAEPSVVDRAAWEFADVEKMIEAAESIGGPYRWGRYDILVLPPSFPFGGMENPRLTFATPTVLAGDRSLTSLVAHELAHSWSGNLVTNATWRDFWLNEGFTTYFENRIMEALYGPDRAAMLRVLGRRELQDKFDELKDTPGDQVLHISLTGRDPDDGSTVVPYDKGAAFLRTVELAVGRPRFDAWLRGYFDRHAFTSLTTAQFLEDFRRYLLQGDSDLEQRLKVAEWIEQPGLPSNAPVETSVAFAKVETEVGRFRAGTPAGALQTSGWTTQEWQHFLSSLPPDLTQRQLADLDHAFNFDRSGNSEVLFTWMRIAVGRHYEPAMPSLDRFLTSQGRRKFLVPLYKDLMATDWGRSRARSVYLRARPLYHSVATSTLDPIAGAPHGAQ